MANDDSAAVLPEHHVRIAVLPAPPAGGKAAAATPEKWLNRFVHLITLVERVGNALGTLAFTWATVVLLGGYPTVLRSGDDFWSATAIVFFEAARMFGRNNRPDYQLFFRTRGALRSRGWNGLVLVVCITSVLVWLPTTETTKLVVFSIFLMFGPSICLKASRLLICRPLRQVISLWSPIGAILLSLLLTPSARYGFSAYSQWKSFCQRIYPVILAILLPLIISRLRFPGIIKLVNSALGRKLVPWRQVIISLCMFAAMVISVITINPPFQIWIITSQVIAFILLSFGNLQIPASLLRVGLALSRLLDHNYLGKDNQDDPQRTNLVPSLDIFYVMVLGQGIFYIVACTLEIFSFILRRFLVCRADFRGHMGVECVNLYYAYAFEKCMGGAMLAPNKISLIRFAMDSLKSDSPKMQLHGVQMLHILLKKEPFKTKAISKLTTSTETMSILFNMLGWTSEEDTGIRSYATKVTAELADGIRVVSIPGAMQLIGSLLDTVHQPKMKDPLLDTDIPEPKKDVSIQQVVRAEQKSPMLNWWKQIAIYCLVPAEEPSNRDEQNSCILRCWKQITKYWSVPQEEPSTNQDALPLLAMSILDRLASFDLENCMEISRAAGLISKIILYTSNKNNMTNIDETHQTLMKGSSLKVLRRLSSTKEKCGVILRQKISEHPFLLSNLAEILHDSGSSQEHRELTAEILRNLAIDGNTREEIGHIRGIISRLMHAFLSQDAPSVTYSDHILKKIAGQTLAVLAIESTNNCSIMLAEPGYVFIKELTTMIHSERFRYVAASLLQNMCAHARHKLNDTDLTELSHILPKVFEAIMVAEGAELEILVGLSSQICNIIPEDFARELEHGQIKEILIKRLVNVLNANMIPRSHCPGIRRVIVEQVIYMMESNSSYRYCFNRCQMMEALLMVELTPSKAESYRFFLGDCAGLMEHSTPLSALVARAKELMARE